jgi:threonine aldolase
MRQAGIIAAAGLYALTNNVQRLEEDHGRARLMAHALSEMGYQVMLPAVPTNMVMLDFPVAVATHAVDHLAQNQVLVGTMGPQRVRLVTHLDIDDEGVTHALRVFRDLSEHIHA